MAGEKVFQLINTPWGMHEFLRGNPRNRRFMHADGFGDVVQHERLHGLVAVLQKTALVFDDLKASKAQWKVIAADMPIGVGVPDGEVSPGVPRWEAVANGDPGAAQGRELEIAELLGFLRAQQVRNHVWLTADVHYCAAHHYHPDRAAFQDFEPFWEFVAGPLNAGSFGPNPLDKTFGPQVVFEKAPPAQNTSPFAGFQFFGEVQIDGQTAELTVTLRDLDGVSVFEQKLQPT